MFILAFFLFNTSSHGALSRTPPPEFLLDPKGVIAAAVGVTSERYPDADRALVDDRVLEVYESDGTSVVWDDEYVKVLTEKGRREASSHSLHYNTNYGTAFFHRAEIIKPDGRIVAVDIAAHSRTMTEPGQMGQNIYDPDNKVLSLSMPGLEVGDLCHLVSCRATTKARMPDTWADYSLFEYDLPIISLDYRISAPPELPVRHKVLRAALSNTVVASESKLPDGRTLHSWRVRDVPQIFPEPAMPPLYTQAQRLIMSTIEDWPTVSRWYWRLCEPALAKTTPEMREMVDELVAGAATRDEKIRRVFKFVSQKIRYMGITTEDTAPGYEPHDVSTTFNNRYGVCRDKAALLVALLRLAGIPAYPVLIHAGAKMDPDVPIPFFNHAVTAVDKPGGGYILMDPTDESTRELFPAYLCNRSFLVARPEGETLLVSEVYPAEKNLARISSDGLLDSSGTLALNTRIVFEGINDNAYRGHFVRLKADQRRKFFEGVLKARLPGAEVISCEIAPTDLQNTEEPLTISLMTRVPDYPVRGERLDMVMIPWLGTSLGYVNFLIRQTGLKERRFTMETGFTCGVEEQVSLRVAEGVGAARIMPTALDIDRVGVEFKLSQSLSDGQLKGTLRYLVKTPEFTPAEYLELKRILEEIEAAGRAHPLCEAFASNAPDKETLSDVTETHLLAPDCWTTTRAWSLRILTYAGKKRNSELKFNYNPAWQSVELLSATVSNLNGVVHQVTPEEINLMDAAWVGAAPRYPAEKTLVVNLPGVETGSVISVATRFTQSNAWCYSQARYFGGTEPVHSSAFKLRYPAGLEPRIQSYHAEAIASSVTTNGGEIIKQWSLEPPRTIRSEELLPPWHLFQPSVFISFGEWRQHARKVRQAVKAVSREDKAARLLARELIRGHRDPLERMLAIRDEVLRTIRIAGPSFLALPATELSTPDRTLADQYGHPTDRAILLAAMLRAAGFKTELVFASNDTTRYAPYGQPSRDVPQPAYFGNPIVLVRHKGRCYPLNEGDQYDELGVSAFDGAPYLNARGEMERLSLPPEMRNRGRSEWVVDLDAAGGARIAVTNWFYGTQAGPFRKKYREILPEDLRRHYLEMVASVAESAQAVSGLEVDVESYPGRLNFAVEARNYAAIDKDALTLMIPQVSGAIFPLRADARENPLFFAANSESEVTCRVILPPGYTRAQLTPEPRNWTLPGGFGALDYDVEKSMRADGRMELLLTRRVSLKAGEAAPELYPALLECNRRLTHPSMRTLVVEK